MRSPLDDTSDARIAFLYHYHAIKWKKEIRQALQDKINKIKRSRASRVSSRKGRSSSVKQGRTFEEPRPESRPTLEYDHSAVLPPIKLRPQNLALQELWKGLEPEIESTFLLWDKAYENVPKEAVYQALGAFEAGQDIGEMHGDLKTALVHIVARAMITGRLDPLHVTIAQVEFFLLHAYRWVQSNAEISTQELPARKHWICGTLWLRTKELDWLIFQAERRWSTIMTRDVAPLEEPSDIEMEALFQTYTQGGDYTHEAATGNSTS